MEIHDYLRKIQPIWCQMLRGCAPVMKDETEYCGHIALAGPHWKEGGCAFYGRATNGWPATFTKHAATADTSAVADKILAVGTTKSVCELGDPCHPDLYISEQALSQECFENPLHWVHHPFRWGARRRRFVLPRQSRFWGAVEAIMRKEHACRDCWASSILWSNLYKISRLRGNPGERLKKAELDCCAELFLWELAHFRPAKVAIMTDNHWFGPLKAALQHRWKWTTLDQASFGNVVKDFGAAETGQFDCKILVTVRPDRRDGSWSQAIAEAFNKLLGR